MKLHRFIGGVNRHRFARNGKIDLFFVSLVRENKNGFSVRRLKGTERGFKIFRFVVMSLKIE